MGCLEVRRGHRGLSDSLEVLPRGALVPGWSHLTYVGSNDSMLDGFLAQSSSCDHLSLCFKAV